MQRRGGRAIADQSSTAAWCRQGLVLLSDEAGWTPEQIMNVDAGMTYRS
jgi:hypothetical protein